MRLEREDEARQYVAEAGQFRAESLEAGGRPDEPDETPLLHQAFNESVRQFACVPSDCGVEASTVFEPILTGQPA